MPKLYSNLAEEQANVFTLVLSASGVPYAAVEGEDGWEIWVKDAHLEKAAERIEAYLRENPETRSLPPDPPPASYRTGTGLWAAAFLLLFHAAVSYHHAHNKMVSLFSASADHIMSGELYRAVTALMLHSGPIHLLGNMVGIALFGTAVCAITRSGMGWLMILLSGVFGNLANAAFYQTSHLSIGASTAVFGAIGILSACRFWREIGNPGRRFRAWLPLGAGLALLGVLGSSGERTDLLAHLFGLLAGLAMGTAHTLLIWRPLPEKYQTGCWILTLGIIAGAWLG